MINKSSDKMMDGAPKQKTWYHFSGDNIWKPKAILADTREEAEAYWHGAKELISQSSSAPAETPPE